MANTHAANQFHRLWVNTADAPLGNTPHQQEVRFRCLELAVKALSMVEGVDGIGSTMGLAAEMVDFVEGMPTLGPLGGAE